MASATPRSRRSSTSATTPSSPTCGRPTASWASPRVPRRCSGASHTASGRTAPRWWNLGRGGVMSADEMSMAAGRLARELGPDELQETLSGITRTAVQTLPDVQEASISILHEDGRLETVAPTSDVLVELDAAQQDLREGPCLQASEEGVHVVSPDLRTDERFPRYGAVAGQSGFLAQAGLNLFVRETSRGALNLYSRRSGSFTEVASFAPLFAQQA